MPELSLRELQVAACKVCCGLTSSWGVTLVPELFSEAAFMPKHPWSFSVESPEVPRPKNVARFAEALVDRECSLVAWSASG